MRLFLICCICLIIFIQDDIHKIFTLIQHVIRLFNTDFFFCVHCLFTDLILLWSIKEKSRKNIWCYTGYTFERLLNNPKQAELLKYIDVLVDGKFNQSLRDESLLFRGSSNQRLIDVKASLKANKTVLLELNYDL